MRYYNVPSITQAQYDLLSKIKENDGYLGQLPPEKRKLILGLATVELSPSGLDMQWTLTADAKKSMMKFRSGQRYNKKYRESNERWRRANQEAIKASQPKEAPLSIEVRDALKSIMEHGHPGTDKMDVLASIQLGSRFTEGYTSRGDGYTHVYGLALFHNGKWLLSNNGREIALNHIRKSECAQFSGKVR